VILDEIPHFLNYVSKNSREIIIIIEKISHRNNLLRIFRKLHLRLSIYFQADIKGNLNLIASRIIPIQERSCMNLCGELNHRDKLEFDSKIYKMSKITISCKKINEIQEAKSKINYDEEKYRNFRVRKKKLIDTTNYLTKFNLKHVLISIKKTYKNQWDENLLLILISNGKSNVLISMGSAQIDFLSYKFIKKNTFDFGRKFSFCFISGKFVIKIVKIAIALWRKV